MLREQKDDLATKHTQAEQLETKLTVFYLQTTLKPSIYTPSPKANYETVYTTNIISQWVPKKAKFSSFKATKQKHNEPHGKLTIINNTMVEMYIPTTYTAVSSISISISKTGNYLSCSTTHHERT